MLDGKFKLDDNLNTKRRRTYYLDTDDTRLKAKKTFFKG